MEGFLKSSVGFTVPPFLAFVAIILFLNRNKTVSALTAIGGAFVSFVIGWPIAFAVFTTRTLASIRSMASYSPFPPA
jgi:hypothetical protein